MIEYYSAIIFLKRMKFFPNEVDAAGNHYTEWDKPDQKEKWKISCFP